MKFLISICNKKKSKQTQLKDVFLFEVSTENWQITPIKLDHLDITSANGITGLVHYQEGIVASIQTNPLKLVYLDKHYNIKNIWTLVKVKDCHSIAVKHQKIYLASCGTDTILEFSPDSGSEKVFWKHGLGEKDIIHLNSLIWHQGELYCTAFGEKKGKLWSSASRGYLMNVFSETVILDHLYHPHSITSTSEGLFVCDSSRMAVRCSDGQKLVIGQGYIRGLCLISDYIIVGVSKGRMISRSTGKVIGNPADPGEIAGDCKVLIFKRRGKRLEGCELIQKIDLKQYGEEIYDIIQL